jgi:hypothetical protein
MQAIGLLWKALEGIDGAEDTVLRQVLAGAEVGVACVVLALAGEAEGGGQGAARQAPGVVPLRGERVARAVQRAPRAAERVGTVPRADAAVKLEEADVLSI